MKNRLDTLYYVFLIIFAATSVVTLLGVVGKLSIDQGNLTLLLSAFLIELAGAVIALFRGAPFFVATGDVASAVSNSAEIIDQLTPQIEAIYLGQTQADVNRHFGIVVRRAGRDLVAYQRVHVISGDDLKKLPLEQQETLETYEKSMNAFRNRWNKLYATRSAATEAERAKIDQELKLLVKEMRKDLTGILDFLAQQGGVLSDHYQHIRGIVDQLAAA